MARNKIKKHNVNKEVRQTIIIVIAAMILCICFTVIVTRYIEKTTSDNLREVVESTVSYISYKSVTVDDNDDGLLNQIKGEYRKQICTVAQIIDDSGYLSSDGQDPELTCSFIRKLANASDLETLGVVDSNGTLVLCQHVTELGNSVYETAPLTPEQFATLKSYAVSSKENYSAAMVVYSDAVYSEGTQYLLTISSIQDDDGRNYYVLGTAQYSKVASILSQVQDRTLFSEIVSDSTGLADFMVVNLASDRVVFTSSADERDSEFVLDHLDLFKNDKEWVTVQTEKGNYKCYVRKIGNELIIGFYNSKDFFHAYLKDYGSGFAISALFLITEALFILYILHLDTMTEMQSVRRGFVVGAGLVSIGFFVLGTMFLESLRIVTSNADMVIRSDTIVNETSSSFEEYAAQLGDEVASVQIDTINLVSEAVQHVPLESGNARIFYETREDGTYYPVLDSFGNEQVTYLGNSQLQEYADAMETKNLWIVNDLGYAVSSVGEDWAFNINTRPEADLLRQLLRGQAPNAEVVLFYSGGSVDKQQQKSVMVASAISLYAYSDGSGTTRYLTSQQYDSYLDNPGTFNNEVRKMTGLLVVEQDGASIDDVATEYYLQSLYENMLDLLKCAYVEIPTEGSEGSRWETCTENLGYDVSFLTIPQEMTTEHYHYFPELSGHTTFTIACMDSAAGVCGQYIIDYDTMMANREDSVLFYFIVDVIIFAILCAISFLTREKMGLLPAVPEEEPKGSTEEDHSLLNFRRTKYGASSIPNALLMFVGLEVTIMALLNILGIFSTGGFSMVIQICSKEWIRELNLYNIGAALTIFGAVTMVMATIDDVVEYLVTPLGGGDLAVAKVVMALLRAAAYITSALYGAALVGVKSSTISAIITVGIGGISLGIRGLFEDLVNGIKLLISNRLYVGQKVKMGGNYYTVEKVGLNQIQLMNDKGEIKYLDAKDANNITYLDGW